MIGLGVGELQRVRRGEATIVLGPRPIEERAQPIAGANPKMMRALRADARARCQIFVVDDLPAGRTLDPEALGHPALLVRRLDGLALLLEPGHSAECTPSRQYSVVSRPSPSSVEVLSRQLVRGT